MPRTPRSSLRPSYVILQGVAQLDTEPNGPVFPDPVKGKPFSDVAVSKALRVAGGEGLTVHGFHSSFR